MELEHIILIFARNSLLHVVTVESDLSKCMSRVDMRQVPARGKADAFTRRSISGISFRYSRGFILLLVEP